MQDAATKLEEKLWHVIKSDRTVMLSLPAVQDGHARPMTAMREDEEHGPLWFFTVKDAQLVQSLAGGEMPALITVTEKGHGLFASLHGSLRVDTDPAVVERLWSPFVAAWYEGGKTDPRLALLRFDPAHAEIWENENSLLAGAKLLLGVDPKKSYKDKVAEVSLR